MLLARRNNNSDWLSNFFDDAFFNTELMPRMNATAPAINVKETEKAYQMEIRYLILGLAIELKL